MAVENNGQSFRFQKKKRPSFILLTNQINSLFEDFILSGNDKRYYSQKDR